MILTTAMLEARQQENAREEAFLEAEAETEMRQSRVPIPGMAAAEFERYAGMPDATAALAFPRRYEGRDLIGGLGARYTETFDEYLKRRDTPEFSLRQNGPMERKEESWDVPGPTVWEGPTGSVHVRVESSEIPDAHRSITPNLAPTVQYVGYSARRPDGSYAFTLWQGPNAEEYRRPALFPTVDAARAALDAPADAVWPRNAYPGDDRARIANPVYPRNAGLNYAFNHVAFRVLGATTQG